MKFINTKNLFKDFFKTLSEINFSFNFKNLSYLPRWIILSIDVVIVMVSGTITYQLFRTLQWHYVTDENLVLGICIQLVINVFFFWSFRIYSGIIRHSSYIDALKLFFSQFSTLIVILFLNTILLFFDHQKIYLTTASFVNAVLSFSFLFFYRIIVKQTFDYFFNDSDTSKQIKVVIYGSDANAIAVANAIKSENPERFKLLGFVDKKNQNSNKRILNVPIYQAKKSLPVLLRTINVDGVIIAEKDLSKEERLILVEECIEYNFKVFILPVVSDWGNQNEIVKNIKSIEILDLLERKPIELDTNEISSKLYKKTILITGAAGSIGSEITRQVLLFKPLKIIILDQAETPLNSLSLELLELSSTVEIINCISDIRNQAVLEQIFERYRPNIVYHAAAYKHVPMMEENPSQAIFTNVLGTKNVADLSCKYNVERFVMISTDKAVNPSSVMGASKRIAEMYIQSKYFKVLNSTEYLKKTKFITTRFGNVLGSNGSVVPLFTKQIREGGPITITHPDIIRYFMTIPEACQLVLEAGSMGNGGEIFIFDMGDPVKIIDLAKKMIRLAGFKPEIDIKIKIVGLRPGEKLYEELLNDTAKNLPTHNEKIMISEEICGVYGIINNLVEQLIENASHSNNENTVTLMKNLVPEFKSLNSKYQSLDTII